MTLLLALFACGSPPADAAEILAAADRHDGVEDHIVHECAGCSMGMPGSEAHMVQHEGYELHFCSEACLAGFSDDPNVGLARIEGVLK